MSIFIYGLVCPVACVVRYVGKSVNPDNRRRAHVLAALRGDYNHRTARWIRKIAKAGHEPQLVILHEVAEGERWQDIERAFIASAKGRGWKLTNSTAGGEGLDFIDPEAEARYKANLSATMSALWSTPERRAEARLRSRKFYADPEAAKAKAEAVRLAYQDPALKARAKAINSEINGREDVRALKRAKTLADWNDPVVSARRRAALGSEATRAKMSAAAKARFADPAAKAYLSTPEQRAKLAESARRRATPEYRAMMAEKTRASWEKRRLKTQDG